MPSVGDLTIQVQANTKKLQGDLNQAARDVRGFHKSIGKIGKLGLGGLFGGLAGGGPLGFALQAADQFFGVSKAIGEKWTELIDLFKNKAHTDALKTLKENTEALGKEMDREYDRLVARRIEMTQGAAAARKYMTEARFKEGGSAGGEGQLTLPEIWAEKAEINTKMKRNEQQLKYNEYVERSIKNQKVLNDLVEAANFGGMSANDKVIKNLKDNGASFATTSMAVAAQKLIEFRQGEIAANDAAEKLADSLERQAEAFGLAGKAAEIMELEQRGANKETLDRVQAASDKLFFLQEAAKVIEDIRTPAEKREEHLTKLNNLFQQGFLTEDQFNRAATLDPQHKETAGAAAVIAGTVEHASAISRFKREGTDGLIPIAKQNLDVNRAMLVELKGKNQNVFNLKDL